MIPYLLTDNSITAYLNGKPLICSKEHINYDKILNKLRNEDIDGLEELFNIETFVNQISDKIVLENGEMFYLGTKIDNSIVQRVITMIKQDFDVTYMVMFLENLLENPSETSINELYDFMSHGNLPITTDGCFIAYKKVREDFFDIHSNSMDNSVGQVVKMEREGVDDNRDRTCSSGLHFCSYDYLSNFGSSRNNKVVALKINPKDVVSIPSDYNNTKGRCCKYEVIEDITENYLNNIEKKTTKLENVSVYRTAQELEIDSYLANYGDLV